MLPTPRQPASAAVVSESPATGGMQAGESACVSLPSELTAALAAAPAAAGIQPPAVGDRMITDKLHDRQESDESTPRSGKRPDASHTTVHHGGTTSGSGGPDAAGEARHGEAMNGTPPTSAFADTAMRDRVTGGARRPMRHYWGQVRTVSTADAEISDARMTVPASLRTNVPQVLAWAVHFASLVLQAVQYLERSVAVTPGKKLMLMAKRDGPRVRFSLRVRLQPRCPGTTFAADLVHVHPWQQSCRTLLCSATSWPDVGLRLLIGRCHSQRMPWVVWLTSVRTQVRAGAGGCRGLRGEAAVAGRVGRRRVH